ncbi:hypothetical protein OLQ82_02925, partial [Campylobacter jejuni]|nr:hypothetical protein [Campylobacter jejuni]
KTDRYLCCNDCIDKEEIFHSDFIKKFHYDTIPSSIIHSFFKMKGKSIYILKTSLMNILLDTNHVKKIYPLFLAMLKNGNIESS